jgi:hypothetical protein
MPKEENKGVAINIGISWEGGGRYNFRKKGEGYEFQIKI